MLKGEFECFFHGCGIVSRLSPLDAVHLDQANITLAEFLPRSGPFNRVSPGAVIVVADIIIAFNDIELRCLKLPAVAGYPLVNRFPDHIPGFLLFFREFYIRFVSAHYAREVITDILPQSKHPLRVPRSRPAGSDTIIVYINDKSMPGCSIQPGIGDLHAEVVKASLDTAQV